MKKIAEYCVKKPITVLMTMMIIVVLGVYSYTKMSLSLFPDMNLPYAVIVTTYEGANPETVEKEVTKPIEGKVSTISNFSSLQSSSHEHYSMITVIFNDDTNMDTAFLDMRESIDSIAFKDGIGKPTIMRISMDMMPIVSVNLSKTFDGELTDEEKLIKTTQWIESDIMTKLEGISGVAQVNVSGAADVVLSINFDQTKLTLYGLTADSVMDKIENSNVDGLVGITTDTDGIKMLYIGNAINGLEEVNNLPIYYDEVNSDIVTLSELCKSPIVFTNDSDDSYNKINGELGVTISFQQETSAELTDVVKNIEKTIKEIAAEDDTVSYTYLLNQGEYVDQAVGSVVQNLIIGAVLAILILLVFLRDIKPTLIVGISIPVSVIGTFALMYFTGIGLNIVSMGGLALGIGMLVDNSVVVIENIFRLLSEGKSKKEAAITGAKQVAGAITASTLTTIAVFLPIMLISGMIGDVFSAMSWTITYSLIASLVIALTLVPSASAKFLKNKEEKKKKEDGKIIKAYTKSVTWALGHKAIVLSSVLVLFVGFTILSFTRGFTLMPETDEGQISASITIEEKIYDQDRNYLRNVTFEEMSNIADKTTEQIMEIDDVETISVSIGSSGIMSALFGGTGNNTISYTILLKDNRDDSTNENKNKIEDIINNYNYEVTYTPSDLSAPYAVDLTIEEKSVSAQSSTSMAFGASGVSIYVKGTDLYELEAVANDLVEILEADKGIKKASNGIDQGDNVVKIEVNKEEAIKLGLTTKEFKDAVNLFYNSLGFSMETTNSLKVLVDGVEYDLNVASNGTMGDMNFPYASFLGMIRVFDSELTEALNNSSVNLYKQSGYKMIINPTLVYQKTDAGIIFSETATGSEWINVDSVVKTTVYDEATDYTEVTTQTGFRTINRDGKYRYLIVSAEFKDGANATKVAARIDDAISDYKKSEDFASYKNTVFITEDGENEAIMEAVKQLLLAGLVAILLVYMIMCIQFQSLKYPLIIMTTIPLAFTGGFIALLITGMEMSIVAIMGLVVLVGIVVNNGIVIIDYMNQLIEEGKPIKEAIVEAGRTRLRPIFMTASTTALALVPMAFAIGEGDELLQPMAIATIGGMIYATLLTLVVVPTIFYLFNYKKIRKQNELATNNSEVLEESNYVLDDVTETVEEKEEDSSESDK